MKSLTRFAPRLAASLLVTSMLFARGSCGAQEVSTPSGNGSGSVFAPSAWAELITPLADKVDLKLFGFFIGELNAPVGEVDATFRATKFLSITPSYMYYTVPASGLNKLAPIPGVFKNSYEERQFRVDATLNFAIQKLELSARNMYTRRYREAPAQEIGRYRGRINLAYPVTVAGQVWKPFANYEAYYEKSGGGWNKDRLGGGVTLPLGKLVWFQPSYIHERTDGIKDVNYLMFGLIMRTGG